MYHVIDGSTHVDDPKTNETTLLANFWAEITQETSYVDGKTQQKFLNIKGGNKDEDFAEVTVAADKFQAMSWVTPEWGVRAVIQPGMGAKDSLRTAIQLESTSAKRITIYMHTGWTKIGKLWTYLHSKGGINKGGNDTSIQVHLPAELSNFAFSNPKSDDSIKPHIRNSLAIMNIAPPTIVWPLLGACYRSAMGKADFAIHLAGKTGTFKTELCSLIQSHFGVEMDARNCPGSWSSTANALEAQAFLLQHTIFVVDDFVPTGTSWQVRQLEKTADQLLRGQGNQAGRSRMRDNSTLQTTFYPRGIILSSGEDIPTGMSIRARMFMIEIAPNDVSLPKLSELQKARPSFSIAMANFIKWLAMCNVKKMNHEAKKMAEQIRDENLAIGHARTPSIIGDLCVGAFFFLKFANVYKAIDDDEFKFAYQLAKESIIDQATMQKQYLETADPVDQFISTLVSMLASRVCHCRTRDGGVPNNAQMLGFEEKEIAGGMSDFKAGGNLIGWVDDDDDTLFLNADICYEMIKRHAKGGLTITKQTMIRRLKDAGRIKRNDANRSRNTIRINCQSAPRTCIALGLKETLKIEEVVE